MGINIPARRPCPKRVLAYIISALFERAAYYGLRAILILHLTGEVIKMEAAQALEILGWIASLLLLSKFIGAFIGDLVTGSRNAIILGGFLQSFGAFSLYTPSITGVYIGVALIVLGGGLYSPNIVASIGKQYLTRTKKLDAIFTLFYIIINLGAFIGIVAIGRVGEYYGYNIGFILSGIILMLSILPIIFLSKESSKITDLKHSFANKKAGIICATAIALALFSTAIDFGNVELIDLQMQLSKHYPLGLPLSIYQSLSSIIVLIVSIILFVIWSFYYSSPFTKLMLGSIFGVLSLGVLFHIPDMASHDHLSFFYVIVLFLGISEVMIAPVLNSVVTKYANAKYLAICMSVALIPSMTFPYITRNWIRTADMNSTNLIIVGIICLVIISIGSIALKGVTNKLETQTF